MFGGDQEDGDGVAVLALKPEPLRVPRRGRRLVIAVLRCQFGKPQLVPASAPARSSP